MPHWLRKMLMQEADGSPGSGAVATSDKSSDNGSPANGQASGAPLTIEALSKLLDERDVKLANRVEANTRRMVEGRLGKGKGSGKLADPPPDDTATASAGEPDMRAFDRATRRIDLSDKQLERMERAFKADAPSDPSSWVAEYLEDLGIKKEAGVVQRKPGDPNARPASDAGAPAAATTATADTPLWRMKPEDRDHLIRKNGLTWYRETLQKQMRGTRVLLRKP